MYLNVNTKLITFGHDMSTLVDITRCVTAWDRFRLNIFKMLFINRLHVYSLPAEMATGAKHRGVGSVAQLKLEGQRHPHFHRLVVLDGGRELEPQCRRPR